MGATAGYCRPVDPTGISTWRAHTNRSTPSVEPGVDYYVPTGTPVRAASSGVVVDVGGSIWAATGRYVTVDLDDGRRVRYLHLLRSRVREGQRVQWGEVIADSGASGYGSDFFGEPSRNDAFWNNTGGDHVHMTLWAHQEYKFGRYATLDPEIYMASEQAAGNFTEDDMTPEERTMLKETHSMLLEVRDYLGARGGHNTKTPNTIGHKVTEIRDYLGAGGAKGNPNEATIGHKINALFARFGKTD